jgi:tetratricopeptide (TPR) repeat protein
VEAVRSFLRAIEHKSYAPAHTRVGEMYFRQGKYEEAFHHFREAVRSDGDDALAHYQLADALRAAGMRFKAARSYLEALAAAGRAVGLDPQDPVAHTNKGKVLLTLGRVEEAIASLREAIRFAPWDGRAYYNLGLALVAARREDEALQAFLDATAADPRLAAAHVITGQIYHRRGRYAEAIVAYGRAVRVDESNLLALNNLAWLLATCPEEAYLDGTRAVELAKKAVALRGRTPSALDTLAAAHAEKKEFKEAVKSQTEALADGTLEKADPTARDRLKLYEAEKPYRTDPPKK